VSPIDGPRHVIGRILHGGRKEWVTPDGTDLVFADGRRLPLEEAVFLPPCDPTKIICAHLNYESRRVEFGVSAPAAPNYVQRPTTSLNSHGGQLERPHGCQFFNYEGELAVVIGRPARNVSRDESWTAIAGFAPANDGSLHDFREADAGSMLRVKGHDGNCAVGPFVVSGVDVRNETVRTYVNGVVVQDDAVSNMIFGIDYLVADISRYITLLPGDIILTGTPAHSRPMEPGDTVEVEVTNVGRLKNLVVDVPSASPAVGHQPSDTDAIRTIAFGSDR
jgi:5-oxopent-3-ene-1,2,5-tricarboxylate decarboxylase/2-hydroxyhepta-2,4-diene-1,7-dioate isomerase